MDTQQTVYGKFPAHFRVETLRNLCMEKGGIQTGPFGSQLHQRDYVPVGTPIITVEHLGENRILHEDLPRVSDSDRTRLAKYLLQDGDIVFSRVGSVDRRALVSSAEEGWLFSGRCLRVRPDPSKVDSQYLSYFLGLEVLREYIRSIAVGATMPSLNTRILSDIPIVLPHLSKQRGIAHVLGTLDDKIELNRRMNRTLEEMTQAIFQDWFVDFGPTRAKMEGQEPYLPPELWGLFPDELVDSELGEIPEGWEISRLEDVAERIAMGPFGSSIKVSTFVDSGIPIISGQHLNGTLLEDGDYRFITEDHADRLARSNVQSGDIVLTHAGNIGQAAYVPNTSQYTRYVISQRQFYMRCDTSKITPLFVVHFFKTQEGQHQLLANTSSTGVPSIARPVTYLRSIALCLPSKDLLTVFDQVVGSYYRTIARNNKEILTLATQRDSLMPKLVSGELLVRPAQPKQDKT